MVLIVAFFLLKIGRLEVKKLNESRLNGRFVRNDFSRVDT